MLVDMVTHREHITLHVKPNTNARPRRRCRTLLKRKATARATSLAEARIAADEKARKLREAADRLAAPKSD